LPDDCVKCAEAKRIVEGESFALSYNDDCDWFDDEDEEFSFEYSEGWFEKAFEDGMAERDEMMNGYLEFEVVLNENTESLDGTKENAENIVELEETTKKN
jgi:hypothetical protein